MSSIFHYFSRMSCAILDFAYINPAPLWLSSWSFSLIFVICVFCIISIVSIIHYNPFFTAERYHKTLQLLSRVPAEVGFPADPVLLGHSVGASVAMQNRGSVGKRRDVADFCERFAVVWFQVQLPSLQSLRVRLSMALVKNSVQGGCEAAKRGGFPELNRGPWRWYINVYHI